MIIMTEEDKDNKYHEHNKDNRNDQAIDHNINEEKFEGHLKDG